MFFAHGPTAIQHMYGPCDGAYSVFSGPLPEWQLRGVPRLDRKTGECYIAQPTWYHLEMYDANNSRLLETIEAWGDLPDDIEMRYVANGDGPTE